MNSVNAQLEDLLQAAARAPRNPPQPAPLALESRVMACWRRGTSGAADITHTLLPLLRRAAFCACLLMLLSIAFSYRTILNGDAEEVMIANSAVDLTVLPWIN